MHVQIYADLEENKGRLSRNCREIVEWDPLLSYPTGGCAQLTNLETPTHSKPRRNLFRWG